MEYGSFVVPIGEVENWLSDLDIDRNKNGWLRNIFEKMGDDPSSDHYIRPTHNDVWDFIGKYHNGLIIQTERGFQNSFYQYI